MSSDDDSLLRSRVRVMQIILSAMFLGAVGLLVASLFVDLSRSQRSENLPVVSLVAVLVAVTNIPLALMLPARIERSSLRVIVSGNWKPPAGIDPALYATDTAKLLAVRQTTMIMSAALLEGAAILGCIAFMLERTPWVLIVTAVTAGLLLAGFPTEGRVRAWLDQHTDLLNSLRQQEG
jgi:hypothetical protein